MKKPILILTALEIERSAVENHLDNLKPEKHPLTGTDYKKGTYMCNGDSIDVIVTRTDQTNVNAAIETERAISHFDPKYAFFVGVAGGLKDVAVGDIVIGQDVYWYERGKVEKQNFKPRPKFGASTYALERLAVEYSSSESWKKKAQTLLDESFAPKINTVCGTIASGEKVIASTNSDEYKFLQQNVSHALAIEMEGLGFLEVCRMRPSVKTLLLRGISDLIDGKGKMDGKGSQPYASANVAAFMFGLLEQLNHSSLSEPRTLNEKLIEVMCKLYPGGLRDNQIWMAAGGDLSLINIYQTGKGQWVEAIRALKFGGGGNISTQSLIEAVYEEHRNNEDVKQLMK